MRDDRGVTLLVLVITVIVLMIVISVGVSYGTSTLETVRFQNFSYELQQIQGKVDTAYEKIKLGGENEKIKYMTLGKDITDSNAVKGLNVLKNVKNINYSVSHNDMSEEDKEKYYYDYEKDETAHRVTTYRYMTNAELAEVFDITSDPRRCNNKLSNKRSAECRRF